MSLMTAGPGCCCSSCQILNDDFYVDNLTADYAQRAGTWTVSDGLLSTSSADALVIANATVDPADGIFLQTLNCFFSTTASGQVMRGVVAYVDDNNYLFAEIASGTTNGTMKLYSRASGTNTQLGSTQTVTGFSHGKVFAFRLCAYNGRLSCGVYVEGSLRASLSTATTIPAGYKAGLATVALTTTFSCSQIIVSRHKHEDNGCAECYMICESCANGEQPSALKMVIKDFQIGGNGCDLNGTYIIPHGPCSADPLIVPGPCPSIGYYWVNVYRTRLDPFNPASPWELHIQLVFFAFDGNPFVTATVEVYWKIQYTPLDGSMPCLEWDNTIAEYYSYSETFEVVTPPFAEWQFEDSHVEVTSL